MSRLIFTCLILLSPLSSSAQLDSNSYKNAIIRIKELLKEKYIVKEKIKLLTDSVGLTDLKGINVDEFVSSTNHELFKYSHDKHLTLEYNPDHAQRLLNNSTVHEEQKNEEVKTNYGFVKLEILPDNIGFLKLQYFADPANLDALIKSVFTVLKDTDALVIDLRGNSGGSGGMLQKLTSGLLNGKPASILSITYKDRSVELKTETKPLFTYKKPVYLLVDRNTFSAGEGFALILQNRKRAIVLGETTAGAGNIAGPHAVDKNFVLTIPVGLIVDPLTSKGWEGTGVVPDIETSPDKALEKVLELFSNR